MRTPINRITDKEVMDVMEDANLAIKLLSMIFSKKFNWEEFLEAYPNRFENLEERAQKMMEYVREGDWESMKIRTENDKKN